LSTLLRDRIHVLEGELRQIFQDDCELIKDWGAPLDSCRKEFKNTTRSLDPLILNIAITTWDEIPGGNAYPTTLEYANSPLLIGSLMEINLPSQPFAGLEANQAFEIEDCMDSDSISAGPSPPSICSYDNPSMKDLSGYGEEPASSPETLHSRDEYMPRASSIDQPPYNTFDTAYGQLTDWEVLFDSSQMTAADYQQPDLGSPIQWGSDPGNSDVALN
jgi:hypothetical protein